VETFEGAAAQWDAIVRASSGWTHCHLHDWRRVVEDALGHQCVYLAAYEPVGGQLRAVLPLVRVRSLLFGHYLVSMPFLNYGGPLGDESAVRALVAEATARAAADGVKLLELRSREPLPVDLPVSHRKITVLLDLPAGDARPVWDGLAAKVRSQVRRPMKDGVTVRFGPEQLDPFYRVFAHHMRDLGTPVLPRRLFERIVDAFPRDVWFGCAWLGDVPVAGGCGFRWAGEFEMTWASSLRAYNRLAPNMLLYWRFMERCVAEGVSLFNFGRCTPGSGTHRFKAQWGSRDAPLYWYQRSAEGASATPSPDDGKYRLATRLWSRLPLAVANRLGPHVVRLIP
jgi:FemAB-related protein (PEP-CTERM system-associated)